MEFKFESDFKASVIFESNVAIGGYTYLIIYGKHINGYYCCIPNWKIGCEMAESEEVFYNTEKLIAAGLKEDIAEQVARAIQYKIKKMFPTTADCTIEPKDIENDLYYLVDTDGEPICYGTYENMLKLQGKKTL